LSDFQTDIPEQGEKTFDRLAKQILIGVVEQDQQVDV
jgi:hypothetical protein